MSIDVISRMFADYKVFPEEAFREYSPLRVFQKKYPDNYYSNEVEEMMKIQKYKQIKRGADLPWWGKDFFKGNEKTKVMIVSQDSLSEDAGSIVFWSQLYGIINNKMDYESYNSLLRQRKLFSYNSWNKVNKQLGEWNIDLNNCYITDAAKVYKEVSYKERDFDNAESKKLLVAEIEVCNPDLIILLGGQPLRLLIPKIEYSAAVDSGEYLDFNGVKVVVSPFITGQGHTQKNYKDRLNIATELIKKEI